MMLNPMAVAGLLASCRIHVEKKEKCSEWEEFLSDHVKIKVVKNSGKHEETK